MPNRKKICFNSRTSKENCIPQTQLSGTTSYAVHIQPLSRQVTVQVLLTPDTVDTVLWADDVWRYRPKHVEQLTDLNKLYSVAACWIFIAILYDARSTERTITGTLHEDWCTFLIISRPVPFRTRSVSHTFVEKLKTHNLHIWNVHHWRLKHFITQQMHKCIIRR